MGVIFAILGVAALISGLVVLVNSFSDEFHNKYWIVGICLIFFAILFIIIPYYKNNEIISIQHIVLNTDTFEDYHYSEVVRIEYDIYNYHWWVYNSNSSTDKKNLKIGIDGVNITKP